MTVQNVLNVLASTISREKQIQVIRIRKEETNCMYMHMIWLFIQKNPKDYILLKLKI